MSTPDQVQFSNNPVEGTQAESELVIFRSELSEYNPASNKFIRINLPVSDKAWIDWSDSILSLKFTNRSADSGSDADDSKVNPTMSDLIKSVSVLNSQGEQIEYVNNYNLISAVMDDYSYGNNHKVSVEQILAGGSPDGNPASASSVFVLGAAGAALADGGNITLCDRLMTGFTSGQYLLPLGYLVGQACALVIELEDASTALTCETPANCTAGYKVENVQIRAKQIRFNSMFNESFERTLAEAGSVGINYITESYLHNQASIPASTGAGVTNIPFSTNPRSAKYILATIRAEADVTDVAKHSVRNRSGGSVQEYSWEISGKTLPSQPIQVNNTANAQNYAQAYAQVLDCLGQIGAINHNTLVTPAGTNTLFYSDTIGTACKFVAGLPLEDFNSATNPSVYSGANLTTVGQMAFRPNFRATVSAAHRVDFFTSIDMSIHFTVDGRMYSVK